MEALRQTRWVYLWEEKNTGMQEEGHVKTEDWSDPSRPRWIETPDTAGKSSEARKRREKTPCKLQWKDGLTNTMILDFQPPELWTEVRDIVQEAVIKTILEKKKCKKAKWLSEEALQIAEK